MNMAKKKRLLICQVEAAIKNSGGIMAVIAEFVGHDPRTVKKFIAKNAKLTKLIEEERDRILDIAENGLQEAIVKKKEWAIRFALSTLGKDRGYRYGNDLTSKNEEINQGTVLIIPDNNRDDSKAG